MRFSVEPGSLEQLQNQPQSCGHGQLLSAVFSLNRCPASAKLQAAPSLELADHFSIQLKEP
jgi:hypothetical protein